MEASRSFLMTVDIDCSGSQALFARSLSSVVARSLSSVSAQTLACVYGLVVFSWTARVA